MAGGCVTGVSAVAESTDKNSGGINDSEDGASASAEVATFAFGLLRGRLALARSAPVLPFFVSGT
jgi:hypothetical protein